MAASAASPPQRSFTQQFAAASLSGAIYGATNAIVGHPFDTVKTKMQAQSGFGGNMVSSCTALWRSEGLAGFYRGVVPPLLGSSIYRSSQFAVYEMAHKQMAGPTLCQRILPGSDMERRVPLAGMLGATARTVLEQPIEYAKVKGQTGQPWLLRELYQGFALQWARTGPMMTFWFCCMDAAKRNGITSTPVGNFCAGGGAAVVGFWIVWPFETLKNQVQAGMDGSVAEKVRRMGGLRGLYRGILPGSISVFSRNGAAVLVMGVANRKMVEWGLKD